jgi:Protein of unknown function (DUF1552)
MGAKERLLSRRRVMRGMLNGSAVTVALPFLDCFLDGNGTALADGSPRRVRFAHWFFGNGFTAGQQWWPDQPGALSGMKLPDTIAPLEAVKTKINILSHLGVLPDGRPNRPHVTGWQGSWLGTVPSGATVAAPSVDTMISKQIGQNTRFQSLGASCTGNAASTMSYLDGGVAQPNEAHPAALYARIFGPDFTDPNAATFTPDPHVMSKNSVLSALKEERDGFADLGADDRRRLDQYFTSLRQVEQQINMQLTKPEPLAACTKGADPGEDKAVSDQLDVTIQSHKIMGQLLAHALLCDQTRSIRLMLTDSSPGLRVAGDSTTYHTYSHQEPLNGPQEKCRFFSTQTVTQLAEFIKMLDSFKEGDSTLLDQTLVIANTDNGLAFTHQLTNLPTFTAGRAGGLIKTGQHLNMNNDPATRLGLTAMQLFKVPTNKFGTDSMETSRPISELSA